MGRRALFLDRDGTLVVDVGYPSDPDAMVLVDGAAETLRRARAAGYALVIVSNQSGVARGLIRPEQAAAVQRRVEELFAAEDVVFDGAYFCFHGPEDGCDCRKPRAGLIQQAAQALDLAAAASVVVGDKESDVAAGAAAGCAHGFKLESAKDWSAVAAFVAGDRPEH